MAALVALMPMGSVALAESSASYQVETVAEGLGFPWNAAFLDDGTILVTELDGQLRAIRDGELDPTPIAGVPEVYRASQGGLFDVVPHPDFATNRLLYLLIIICRHIGFRIHTCFGALSANSPEQLIGESILCAVALRSK